MIKKIFRILEIDINYMASNLHNVQFINIVIPRLGRIKAVHDLFERVMNIKIMFHELSRCYFEIYMQYTWKLHKLLKLYSSINQQSI